MTMIQSSLIGITQHTLCLTARARTYLEHMQSGKNEPAYRVRAGMYGVNENRSNEEKNPTMKMTLKAQNQILKTVAREYRVTVAEMRGRVRKQRVVRARAAVAKMLYEDFRQALIPIARLLNKNTNMGHHYIKLSQDYQRDYDWHKRYQQARFESIRDLM